MRNYPVVDPPPWQTATTSHPTLNPQPAAGSVPVMAYGHDGAVHLLWSVDDFWNPAQFIYHTNLITSTWSAPAPVSQSLGASSAPSQPLVAPDGTLHLMWLNEYGTYSPNRVLYAAFQGGHWTPAEEVYRETGSNAIQWAVPQLDADGHVEATIDADPYDSALLHMTRTASGWGTPVLVQPANSLGFIFDVVWPDRIGGIHFYRLSVASNTYTQSYWIGGGFVVQDQPIPAQLGSPNWPTTRLDAQGNLHMYWTGLVPVPGGQVTGLYHQCLDANLNLSNSEVVSGQSALGGWAVATDESGRSAISWHEGNAILSHIALYQGCVHASTLDVPKDAAGTWNPEAIALSTTPNRLCAFSSDNGLPPVYTVQCVDLS
jgi:hypothetical protein